MTTSLDTTAEPLSAGWVFDREKRAPLKFPASFKEEENINDLR